MGTLVPMTLGNEKGFTLLEVLSTSGICLFMYYLFTSNAVWVNQQNIKNYSVNDVMQLRETVMSLVKDDQSFYYTAKNSQNASFGCFKVINGVKGDCFNKSGDFNLMDASGKMIVETKKPTSGFTRDGTPCNTYKEQVGNDLCPYRMKLSWRALCKASPCTNPLIEINGTLDRSTKSFNKLPQLNLANFRFSVYRKSLEIDAAGPPPPPPLPVPVPVPPLGNLIEAFSQASDKSQTCVIFAGNRQIKCWGWNSLGALGLGHTLHRGGSPSHMGNNLPFLQLGTGVTFAGVSNGLENGCALSDDGKVKCWGRNNNGQSGQGNTTVYGDSFNEVGDTLNFIDLGTGVVVNKVSSRGWRHCASTTTGQIKCWGRNSGGDLGLGDTNTRGDNPGEMGDNLPFLSFGTGRTVKDFCVGAVHSCAILDNDRLKCWGANYYSDGGDNDGMNGSGVNGPAGNLGNSPGEMGDALPYVDLGTGRTVKQVSCGAYHTCAVLDNDLLKCWGENKYGQLGHGNTVDRGDNAGEMGDSLPYTDLGTGKTIKKLSAGIWHSCAILNDDTVKCWGDNQNGGLGVGSTQRKGDGPGEMGDNLPVLNIDPLYKTEFILAGFHKTCALLENKRVKCWGVNQYGELGIGNYNQMGDSLSEMGANLPFIDLGDTSP